MKKKKTVTIECEPIEIKGSLSREEIVKKVINIFIATESYQRGHGVKFRYPVENLSINKKLFILRPAGLRKWNFDFKVEVLEEFRLGKGTHDEIVSDFQSKKQENPQRFKDLLDALSTLYNCLENDVDVVLGNYNALQKTFQTGAKVDVLLKVVKWMFIMEDIVYWNYKGRAMLYNAIKGV
ncbi:hypothetical protein J7M23_07185 [Candidatus Sumerlaeota bacterium]|nr:hypothetical protein [Candidatus Sumerlaeota bacterium]